MLKKLLSGIGVIVALMVWAISGQIGKEAGKAAFSPSKPSQEQIEAKLIEGFEQAAKQVNASTPTMIDDDTRMDKATVGPGPRVTYHYTFPKYSSHDIDPKWLTADLRPLVKNNVCSSSDMKASLQYGGVYAFSYSGNDGINIGSFQVSRHDCGFSQLTP